MLTWHRAALFGVERLEFGPLDALIFVSPAYRDSLGVTQHGLPKRGQQSFVAPIVGASSVPCIMFLKSVEGLQQRECNRLNDW